MAQFEAKEPMLLRHVGRMLPTGRFRGEHLMGGAPASLAGPMCAGAVGRQGRRWPARRVSWPIGDARPEDRPHPQPLGVWRHGAASRESIRER